MRIRYSTPRMTESSASTDPPAIAPLSCLAPRSPSWLAGSRSRVLAGWLAHALAGWSGSCPVASAVSSLVRFLPSPWGEMPMPFGNVGARDEVADHGGLKMAGVVGRYAALSVMVTA